MNVSLLTVTLNPAIDETISIGRLERGTVHRARSVRFDAGGKGVNVASCLADWGAGVAVTGILGAENASVFAALFASKGIVDRFVRVPGTTRTNVKLVDDDETTDINLPGTVGGDDALAAVDAVVGEYARPSGLVVLAGSLPRDAQPERYAQMIAMLHAGGARAVLDVAGPALSAALQARAVPFCVKPNRQELEDWAGRPLRTIDELAAAARDLRARGVALVVVSLGADGALFASAEGEIVARHPIIHVESTVGAGDAMVAGIVAALLEHADLERIARLSTAFAVAKLTRAGAHLPPVDMVSSLARAVDVTRLGSREVRA